MEFVQDTNNRNEPEGEIESDIKDNRDESMSFDFSSTFDGFDGSYINDEELEKYFSDMKTMHDRKEEVKTRNTNSNPNLNENADADTSNINCSISSSEDSVTNCFDDENSEDRESTFSLLSSAEDCKNIEILETTIKESEELLQMRQLAQTCVLENKFNNKLSTDDLLNIIPISNGDSIFIRQNHIINEAFYESNYQRSLTLYNFKHKPYPGAAAISVVKASKMEKHACKNYLKLAKEDAMKDASAVSHVDDSSTQNVITSVLHNRVNTLWIDWCYRIYANDRVVDHLRQKRDKTGFTNIALRTRYKFDYNRMKAIAAADRIAIKTAWPNRSKYVEGYVKKIASYYIT